MAKSVVLIAEDLSPATVEALGPDFDIRQVDGANRTELLSALPEAHAVLIRSATQMDAEALAAAKKLKVIARAGVGLDNVDIKAATEAGVMVVNAPTSNIVSAAELAIATFCLSHVTFLVRMLLLLLVNGSVPPSPESNCSTKQSGSSVWVASVRSSPSVSPASVFALSALITMSSLHERARWALPSPHSRT